MKWREVGGKREEEVRPSLAAVLEHYNWRFSPSKGRQMVSCLFHADRTPSMSIDLTRGVFNCHSCGEGGDVWTLLMKKEGIDFAGARELATSLGLTDGGAGGGGHNVSGGSHAGRWRSGVPREARDRRSAGGYTPSWRRR